jgi:hypothetical protein
MVSPRQRLLVGVAGLSLAFGAAAARAQQRPVVEAAPLVQTTSVPDSAPGSSIEAEDSNFQDGATAQQPDRSQSQYYRPDRPPSAQYPGTAPRQGLTSLPSMPALDQLIEQHVVDSAARRGFHVARPAPQVEAKLQAMMAQIRQGVPGAVPEARQMAGETRFYVIPDEKDINLTSTTMRSPDGHAVNAIVITQGALDKLGTEPLRAALGHEFSHHLFRMNPELLNNPRYEPKSQSYQNEIARTNFTPTEKEVEAYYTNYAIKNHQVPTREQIADYVHKTQAQRRDTYKEEAMADKIGLRLTRDVYPAQIVQVQIADGHLQLFNPNHPDTATIDKRGIADPHPSTQVRLDENLVTQQEMTRDGIAKPAAPRAAPSRPGVPQA